LTGRALRGKGGSWREVITSMGGGGLLGTALSLLAEGALVILLLAVVSLALWVMPGGAERVRELFESFGDPASLEDSAVLVRWLLNPVVLLFAVGVMGVAVPVIEEAVKTLAVGVAGAWVRPHAARAFLWGVASGAGFAIAENLINGAIGGQEAWVAGAVARVGATVMHCFTGGLVGWGWGQLWTRRRPLRMLGSVVAAVVLHGIWNTLAIGTMVLGAVAVAHQAEPIWQGLAWSGVAILVGMLGVIAMACAVALPLIARRLAKADGSSAAEAGESSLEAAGDQCLPAEAEVAA
jgi:RsiW-degrading membrane proteinase PrsW (M82 family)